MLDLRTAASDRRVDPGWPRIEVRPCRWGGFVAIVELHGEHDLATREAVRVALARLRGPVLVDLSACTFIDSSVIRELVDASLSAAAGHGRLELIMPPPGSRARRSLEILGVPGVIATREGQQTTRSVPTGALPPRSAGRGEGEGSSVGP